MSYQQKAAEAIAKAESYEARADAIEAGALRKRLGSRRPTERDLWFVGKKLQDNPQTGYGRLSRLASSWREKAQVYALLALMDMEAEHRATVGRPVPWNPA